MTSQEVSQEVMNRSQEIIKIFEPLLTRDLITYILQIGNKQIFQEAMDYWIDIVPIYRIPIYICQHRDRYRLEHIKRMGGSVINVNEENREIKYLKLCNEEWIDAWKKVCFRE